MNCLDYQKQITVLNVTDKQYHNAFMLQDKTVPKRHPKYKLYCFFHLLQ